MILHRQIIILNIPKSERPLNVFRSQILRFLLWKHSESKCNESDIRYFWDILFTSTC